MHKKNKKIILSQRNKRNGKDVDYDSNEKQNENIWNLLTNHSLRPSHWQLYYLSTIPQNTSAIRARLLFDCVINSTLKAPSREWWYTSLSSSSFSLSSSSSPSYFSSFTSSSPFLFLPLFLLLPFRKRRVREGEEGRRIVKAALFIEWILFLTRLWNQGVRFFSLCWAIKWCSLSLFFFFPFPSVPPFSFFSVVVVVIFLLFAIVIIFFFFTTSFFFISFSISSSFSLSLSPLLPSLLLFITLLYVWYNHHCRVCPSKNF